MNNFTIPRLIYCDAIKCTCHAFVTPNTSKKKYGAIFVRPWWVNNAIIGVWTFTDKNMGERHSLPTNMFPSKRQAKFKLKDKKNVERD